MRSALWIAAAILVAQALAACPPAEGRTADSVEAVIERLAESSRLPPGTRFLQDVTVRFLLSRWSFRSVLHFDGEHFHVTTEGAPSFVPASLPADLVGLATTPALFDLALVEPAEDGDDDLLVLSGKRIDYPGTGAEAATFWVDAESWTVVKAEAVYPWGTLTVDQVYGLHGKRRLLERQTAGVRPYGLVLEVTYRGYEFAADAASQTP